MEELITTFHIDWRLMVAQLVNFAIVAAILWRFALKPLMKTMEQRTATIEKSLKDAERIEHERAETAQETKRQIIDAQKKALAIMEQAKKQAEVKRQELLTKAKSDVESIVASAKEQIQQEKETMLTDAKKDLASLVTSGVEKVLSTTVTGTIDQKIISSRLNNLK